MKERKILAVILGFALVFGLLSGEGIVIQESRAAESDYGISNPRVEKKTLAEWDCIYFGSYWQNDTNGDGVADQNDEKEPIKWRILSQDGDDVFLLADQILDCQPYNVAKPTGTATPFVSIEPRMLSEENTEITWENCSLRKWLNKDFYNDAFNEEEKEAIRTTEVVNEDDPKYGNRKGENTEDKIYLLSIDEATNPEYGFPSDTDITKTRKVESTAYAARGSWWLRSLGRSEGQVAEADSGGKIYPSGTMARNNLGVRPVLHLNLSSHAWEETKKIRIEDTVSTWDCIEFGSYWQNTTNEALIANQDAEKEPIKWRVLSVNGKDAFLLADQNLDYQYYNYRDYSEEYLAVTWETCSLRKWLNEDFYNAAFNDEEKGSILTTEVVNEDNPEYGTAGGNNTEDKIYLLSINEVINPSYGFASDYGFAETREFHCTKYARSKWTSLDERLGCVWLRSPGGASSGAALVNIETGSVSLIGSEARRGESFYFTNFVRPVLHIDLSSSQWKNAGTVSSSEEESGNTPTETPSATPTDRPTPTPAATPEPPKAKPTNALVNSPSAAQGFAGSTPAPTDKPDETAVTAPAKVKKVTAKNSGKKAVTLSWKAVTEVEGYQVQYALNKKFTKTKKTKLIKKNKNKVTIKKLKKKTYYFRVRAYKLNGTKKVYGKWSKAMKVKVRK